jgi:hypothetical protein
LSEKIAVELQMDLTLVRLAPVMLNWLGPGYMTPDELSLRAVRCTLLFLFLKKKIKEY